MNFEYVRKPTSVTVFGKEYEIPTKTAYFVDAVNKLHKAIIENSGTIKSTELTLEGIALFLGEKFVKERYGGDINILDTDEIGALWVFLNRASAEATAKVLNEYAPVKISR